MKRIRTRIVVAFLVVALLPALPLSLLVGRLLTRTLDLSRAPEVEAALEAAMERERQTLAAEKRAFAREAGAWVAARRTGAGAEPAAGAGSDAGAGLAAVRVDAGGGVEILTPETSREARLLATDPAFASLREDPEPPEPERIAAGRTNVLAMALPDGDGRVLLAVPLAADAVRRAESVEAAVRFLRTAEQSRGALVRSLVLPFMLIYALLLALAAGVGALLAARIARPVEALVAATRRVATGDLDARVDVRSEGETRALVESFNEMTEKLRAQRIEIERLARLAAWRDIARAVAHELKNPLTPIHLAVQQMRESYRGGDPEYRAALEECGGIVDEEVKRLRDLVREFSEFARFPRPNPQWNDLSDTLCDVARLYGGRARFERPPFDVRARYDDAQIRRALVNLVENGLAACRAAGRPEEVRLAVDAGARPGAVAIRIADRGSGIAPQDLPRIFEPDFSTRKEGMGLGLAIVEAVVRGHGGTVDVTSRAGEGTTMTITLPVEGPAQAAEPSDAAPTPAPAAPGRGATPAPGAPPPASPAQEAR